MLLPLVSLEEDPSYHTNTLYRWRPRRQRNTWIRYIENSENIWYWNYIRVCALKTLVRWNPVKKIWVSLIIVHWKLFKNFLHGCLIVQKENFQRITNDMLNHPKSFFSIDIKKSDTKKWLKHNVTVPRFHMKLKCVLLTWRYRGWLKKRNLNNSWNISRLLVKLDSPFPIVTTPSACICSLCCRPADSWHIDWIQS